MTRLFVNSIVRSQVNANDVFFVKKINNFKELRELKVDEKKTEIEFQNTALYIAVEKAIPKTQVSLVKCLR